MHPISLPSVTPRTRLTGTALDYSIRDPPLTPQGLVQCEDLQNRLKKLALINDVGLIVTSPMRRALQTTQQGLDWLLQRGIPTHVSPDFTETSTAQSDVGSTIDVLSAEFPQFKFNDVYAEWPDKVGKYAFTDSAIEARGLECRRWLKRRPEKAIIVVSHADFMFEGLCSTIFQNAQYRIFDFAEEDDILRERFDAGQRDAFRRASFS